MYFIILAGVTLYAAHDVIASPSSSVCSVGHKGILLHVKDKKRLSEGCKVTAILRKDCLSLLR